MSATWPSTLPAPLLSGFTLAPMDAVVRTDMDAGISRMRRRYRNPPVVYSVAWTMNSSEYRAFAGWYESVVAFGSQSFTMTLPGGSSDTVTARFAEVYSARYLSADGVWSISAKLEISDRTTTVYLATEAGDQLTTEGGDNLRLE